jgi:Flp pilus assembly protein TadD
MSCPIEWKIRGCCAQQERELGNTAFGQQHWDAAVAHYSKAISLRRSDASLWSNRAAAYLAKGW